MFETASSQTRIIVTIIKKIFFAILFIIFENHATAGIIVDNNTYTTVNELDWLDFKTTVGKTQQQVLATNIGWRAATQSEMKSMMESFFFDDSLLWSDANQVTHGYAQFTERGELFVKYFGETDGFDSSYATSEGYGLIGIDQNFYAGFGYSYANVGYSSSSTGIALVRKSIIETVPEPSTLAIFGLALMGLTSRRLQK